MTTYPFVQARWYTKSDGRNIDLVVVHTMEAPEKGTTAEAVARYFATTNTKASAHYNVDVDSVVQSVRDRDIAYAAPGANHNGVHIEHAGYANQTAAQWDDEYSRTMLARSAALCAELCRRHAIPARWLTAAELTQPGATGITSHANVSAAFKRSTHTDPGPNFPVNAYLTLVDRILHPQPARPTVTTITDAILCPQGDGAIAVAADGGVFNLDGCGHFYGSYPGLPEQFRQGDRTFVAIVEHQGGYAIVANDAATYHFPAS